MCTDAKQTVDQFACTITHMLASEFSVACKVNVHDGRAHTVTGDFENVNCTACRDAWSAYMVDDLMAQVRKLKSEVKRLETEQSTRGSRRIIHRAKLGSKLGSSTECGDFQPMAGDAITPFTAPNTYNCQRCRQVVDERLRKRDA